MADNETPVNAPEDGAIVLRPGERFRLGRTAYEVQATAEVDAVLVVNDGEKDGIRQVLYTCPKGCISKGTGRVWKVRCSRKQHAAEPAICPICKSEVTAGTPNADKPQPKPEPQPEPDPNAGKPEDGQEAMAQENAKPQPSSKGKKGKKSAESDLKDALEQAQEQVEQGQDEPADEDGGDEASPKGSKPSKSGKPKGKQPKGGKGKGAKPSPAEAKLEQAAKELVEKMAEDLMSAEPEGVEPEPEAGDTAPAEVPPPPAKPSVRKCFNCEHPTGNAPGKGDITLCNMCEDMRQHILECLED